MPDVPTPLNVATPDERLRWAFAQMMQQQINQGGPLTPEALWAMQGKQQLGGPPVDQSVFEGWGAPTPRFQSPPGLDFPTAGPGPGDQPKTSQPAQQPFPGAKEVEVKPYDLPKSKKTKDKDD